MESFQVDKKKKVAALCAPATLAPRLGAQCWSEVVWLRKSQHSRVGKVAQWTGRLCFPVLDCSGCAFHLLLAVGFENNRRGGGVLFTLCSFGSFEGPITQFLNKSHTHRVFT